MTALLAQARVEAPDIDWAGLSPLLALIGGAVIVFLAGLIGGRSARRVIVPVLTLGALGAALGLTLWQWGERKSIMEGALAVDDLALYGNLLFIVAGAAAVLMAWRQRALDQSGEGEFHGLLLSSIAGMAVLAASQNTVALFLGIELLSIPLYVLCATELRRETSLEAGLKYLVIGSVGSATLLYGLALLYGATGGTDFATIARELTGDIASDPLALTGIGLVIVGLAFKASVAPFHQWTPDVYEGAPTPITAFMAVATKAAAFVVLLRFFDVAVINAFEDWAPALAVLATVTIIIGNLGALGQTSLKRMLAWSGVGQAGYLLAGVVVSTRLGIQATCFYLAVYLFMNMAAFAVVLARERETDLGDDISSVAGIGATRPVLAWPLTIAMLALAGFPATAGFIGKFYLIDAAVDNGYAWLGIVIVIGSMISLGYYLRVVAAVWMQEAPIGTPGARPAIAGASQEADEGGAAGDPAAGRSGTERDDREGREWESRAGQAPPPPGEPTGIAGDTAPSPAPPPRHPFAVGLALLFGAATLFFGIIPSPLMDLARDAGASLPGLF